jgi:hypothetical protein
MGMPKLMWGKPPPHAGLSRYTSEALANGITGRFYTKIKLNISRRSTGFRWSNSEGFVLYLSA